MIFLFLNSCISTYIDTADRRTEQSRSLQKSNRRLFKTLEERYWEEKQKVGDYGEYEGLTTSEIRESTPGWTVWSGDLPGGETIEQVAARCRRVIDRALDAHGDVVLFAHGHVLRVLTATWLGLPPEAGRLVALDTAAVGILGYEHEYHVIRKWNEDGILAR